MNSGVLKLFQLALSANNNILPSVNNNWNLYSLSLGPQISTNGGTELELFVKIFEH